MHRYENNHNARILTEKCTESPKDRAAPVGNQLSDTTEASGYSIFLLTTAAYNQILSCISQHLSIIPT
jgi:hypothetical protein